MSYLLSIDGSTKATGVALFDKKDKTLIDYKEFKSSDKDMRQRVIFMIDSIKDYILKYKKIDEIVMEQVIPAINNSSTVLALGILQGGVLEVAHSFNLNVNYITVPYWHGELDIKKSNGDLKEQSINWVNKKFKTDFKFYSPKSTKNDDNICDAIALGCVYMGNYNKAFGKSKRRQ